MFSRNLSRWHTYLFGGTVEDPAKVILIGLDAAGKTTFLYKASSHIVTAIPTIGFNVETALVKKAELKCWDIGGCDKLRNLWRHYTRDSVAVVLFIDSNDKDRIEDAKHELDIFLNDETMVGVPLLVVANKQDLPNASTVEEIAHRLNLHGVQGHEWSIIPASVAYGRGVSEIIAWIKMVASDKRTSSPNTAVSASAAANEVEGSADTVAGHLIHVTPPTVDTTTLSTPPTPPSSTRVVDDITVSVQESWIERTDVDEEQFLVLLNSYQLDIWDHYTHVRIAWVLIKNHGIRDGFNRVEESIRAFIEHSARTDSRSFHATMTRFWCHMIAYTTQLVSRELDPDHSKAVSFKDFINAVCAADGEIGLEVPLWDKTLFKKYYTSSAMFSTEVRATAGPPDLLSLPDIVPLLRSNEPEVHERDVGYLEGATYWQKST